MSKNAKVVEVVVEAGMLDMIKDAVLFQGSFSFMFYVCLAGFCLANSRVVLKDANLHEAGKSRINYFHGFGQGIAFLKNDAVQIVDVVNLLCTKIATAQANNVYTNIDQWLACSPHKRRHIFSHQGSPGNKTVSTYACKLLYAHLAFNDSPVVYKYMTSQIYVIGQDDIVAQKTVMSNMHIGHKETVAAHPGRIGLCSSSVDGNMLAYNGIVTDNRCCVLTLKLEILRNGRNDCPGKNLYIIANPCSTEDGNVRAYPAVVTDFNVFVNETERTDDNILAYCCRRINRLQ
jgi:hypothetical protein